ncbi:MAG: RsmE family RNA methyltransferase [Verrucomicrobiota bacterium]
MPRCVVFASELSIDDQALTLSKAESHHIFRVLRASTGQAVKVINGSGLIAETELVDANPSRCQLNIRSITSSDPAPYSLTFAPAVIKGKSMDNVIRMATELGVSVIQPIYTQHGDVPLSAFDSGSKLDKWRTVAIEACKQCENPWLPEIRSGLSFSNWLENRGGDEALVFGSLEAGSRPFRGWRSEFEDLLSAGKGFAVTLGPEGDFTPDEYAVMRKNGGFAVFLGRCILRSETATPALLAGLIATLPST